MRVKNELGLWICNVCAGTIFVTVNHVTKCLLCAGEKGIEITNTNPSALRTKYLHPKFQELEQSNQ